jgi:hypothetical protein
LRGVEIEAKDVTIFKEPDPLGLEFGHNALGLGRVERQRKRVQCPPRWRKSGHDQHQFVIGQS